MTTKEQRQKKGFVTTMLKESDLKILKKKAQKRGMYMWALLGEMIRRK